MKDKILHSDLQLRVDKTNNVIDLKDYSTYNRLHDKVSHKSQDKLFEILYNAI